MEALLRLFARSVRGSVGPWTAGLVALACSNTPNYFNEPPPAQGGHATGGTPAAGGNPASGSAGTSPSGETGVGGSSERGGSGSGDSGSGGSGSSGGSSDGAKGGDTTLGGSGSKGGSGGTDGGSGGVGAGGQSGTSGGGTNESGAAGDVGMAGAGGESCGGKPEVCDGVSNDCDEEIDEGDVCPADCTAKTYDGHVYLLCITTNEEHELAYAGATAYCDMASEELGLGLPLALARIDSEEESDFAKRWVRQQVDGTGGEVWLGANDVDEENQWVWGREPNAAKFFTGFNQGGGTPYQGAFNDWAPGRPNAANGEDEDCGGMDSELDWRWNDLVCHTARIGWLCEQTP